MGGGERSSLRFGWLYMLLLVWGHQHWVLLFRWVQEMHFLVWGWLDRSLLQFYVLIPCSISRLFTSQPPALFRSQISDFMVAFGSFVFCGVAFSATDQSDATQNEIILDLNSLLTSYLSQNAKHHTYHFIG